MSDDTELERRIPGQKRSIRPLRWYERVAAICGGAAVGTLGFLAVFRTSNEVGTGAALLVSGVLLLIGIQGTPLTRLAMGDKSIDLSAPPEQIAETAIEKASDGKPEQARAYVQGYLAADPQLAGHPAIRGSMELIYERQIIRAVHDAIGRTGLTLGAQEPSHGPDMIVEAHDQKIMIDAAYVASGRRLGRPKIQQLLELARGNARTAVVIVTNAPGLTPDAAETAQGARLPVQVVQWSSNHDTEKLATVIHRLSTAGLSQIPLTEEVE